jgi:hypothetical protein
MMIGLLLNVFQRPHCSTLFLLFANTTTCYSSIEAQLRAEVPIECILFPDSFQFCVITKIRTNGWNASDENIGNA